MALELYSGPQRLAFAGLAIGSILSIIGVLSNSWYYGKVEDDYYCRVGDNDVPWCNVREGLWYNCFRYEHVYSCKGYRPEGENYGLAVRILCIINVLLTLLCAIAPLFRPCFCNGGHKVGHGLVTLLSGIMGIAATSIFIRIHDESFWRKVKYDYYDYHRSLPGRFDDGKCEWGLYTYLVGCIITTLMSFHLCLLTPKSKLPFEVNFPGLKADKYATIEDQPSACAITAEEPGRPELHAYSNDLPSIA